MLVSNEALGDAELSPVRKEVEHVFVLIYLAHTKYTLDISGEEARNHTKGDQGRYSGS